MKRLLLVIAVISLPSLFNTTLLFAQENHKPGWFFSVLPLLFDDEDQPRIIRGPYLQMLSDTNVKIRWRTDHPTNSRVLLGLSTSSLNQEFINNISTTEHEILVDNLLPNTRYYYSVDSENNNLTSGEEYFFETSPKTGESAATRIWVIGDSGTQTHNQRNVYDAYKNFTTNTYTNMLLMLGDNAYNYGTDIEYQTAFFDIYRSLLTQTPAWSAIGNHDAVSVSSIDNSGPYYDIFNFPTQGELGGIASETEAYYSFDYGDIHFVVLDSVTSDRSLGGEMTNWLFNDLQQNSLKWTIAMWHHPPYTKGSHDSDVDTKLIEMRHFALPILEQHGVDLVLSGHSHSYERSKFIDGHYGLSSDFDSIVHIVSPGSGRPAETGAYKKDSTSSSHGGTVYITAGSSGRLTPGSFGHNAMYVSLYNFGSVIIDISNSVLSVRFLSEEGLILDSFVIDKS